MALERLRDPGPGGLRGELGYRVPMARYVTWRAGGMAARLYKPADLDDLALFLASLEPEEPVYFIGLGSNLLVRDGGLRGTVIALHGALAAIRLESRRHGMPWAESAGAERGVVYAEAGVASPKIARFAARHDLVGAEFLAGIPGTLGGALAMNAGCYGHETWEYVVQVQTIDRAGRLRLRRPQEFQVGYRHVELAPPPAPGTPGAAHRLHLGRDEWFVAGWLALPRGDGAAAREEIKRLLAKRVASQPLGEPNAGSVFRNPPGDHAARLIETCGLKGRRIGGAEVSRKHANFIVNTGNATAADIEALIELVQATVEQQTGIRLVPEVRIIGDK